mgnify:CR=1 FL=1
MLEEDALSFDAFLKENDEKVQEAIKRADVEAKSKQDKVWPILRLPSLAIPGSSCLLLHIHSYAGIKWLG